MATALEATGPAPAPWGRRELARKFVSAAGANVLALSVSLGVTLLLPKFIGVTDFSYWQLYIFYLGYVGFFQLGWNDGVLLRYGGSSVGALRTRALFSQFWMLAVTQLVIALVLWLVALASHPSPERVWVFGGVAVGLCILALRWFCTALLQVTGRVRAFALVQVTESMSFIALVATLARRGTPEFQVFMLCDLGAKCLALVLAIYYCRDVVLRKLSDLRWCPDEAWESIRAGCSLMLANILGMLCIGVVRQGIEVSWSVVEFGLVSLTLSVTTLFLVFFNTLGIILFPQVRRLSAHASLQMFKRSRAVYVSVALMLLALGGPLQTLLTHWLPSYSRGFEYFPIVLPIVVFEGKTTFLVNTYLRARRQERSILLSNLVGFGVSVVLTLVATTVLHSLPLAVMTILIAVMVRGLLAERALAMWLGINLLGHQLLEVSLVGLYITIAWVYRENAYLIAYVAIVALSVWLKRGDLPGRVRRPEQVGQEQEGGRHGSA